MSDIGDIIKREKDGGASLETSNERVTGQSGQLETSRDRPADISDTAQRSAPLNLMTDKKVSDQLEAKVQATLPAQPKVSEEVQSLLDKENPEAEGHYLYPRHFAQLSNRKGFTLYISTRNADGQSQIPVVFEEGTFSTTSMSMVDALHKAIKRKDGVSAQIKEISASHYASIVETGHRYNNLKSINGMVNSGDSKPFTGGKSSVELMQENEDLKAKLAEMQNQVGAVATGVEKSTSETTAPLFPSQS